MKLLDISKSLRDKVSTGTVIPAHPLALDRDRKFDPQHQKALTKYYIDAGVGGIAIGVHSTQFEIRKPGIDLFEPVLSLAAKTIDSYGAANGKTVLKIAGVCGKTEQALKEASFTQDQGYHACLLSLSAMAQAEVPELINHCRKVAAVMPLIGFYLQPSVGGRILPFEFWREFAQIENILAIKMAPFNRYQTFDVVRAVCEAGREQEITLYTGNDDNILLDLLTEYKIETSSASKTVRIKGGLLGHWAVWTKKAVDLLAEVHALIAANTPIPAEMLSRAIQITDSNAAFFDPAHAFAGCIPGIHEVLRRQGLIAGTWCLNPREQLSPGQAEEIDRVYRAYPHLNDDAFVRANLAKWLED